MVHFFLKLPLQPVASPVLIWAKSKLSKDGQSRFFFFKEYRSSKNLVICSIISSWYQIRTPCSYKIDIFWCPIFFAQFLSGEWHPFLIALTSSATSSSSWSFIGWKIMCHTSSVPWSSSLVLESLGIKFPLPFLCKETKWSLNLSFSPSGNNSITGFFPRRSSSRLSLEPREPSCEPGTPPWEDRETVCNCSLLEESKEYITNKPWAT